MSNWASFSVRLSSARHTLFRCVSERLHFIDCTQPVPLPLLSQSRIVGLVRLINVNCDDTYRALGAGCIRRLWSALDFPLECGRDTFSERLSQFGERMSGLTGGLSYEDRVGMGHLG